MSSSKRHFTVVIGNKEHGLYISSTPSSAARKAVSKLCADNKNKKVEFFIRETTQGSNKKVYGPYIGYMQKLEKPIELEGRIIHYKPIAKLNKKSHKMKGGGEIIGEGGEGIVYCPNIINNHENRVSKVVRNSKINLIPKIEFIGPLEEKLNEIDPEGRYHVPMISIKSSEEINKNKLNGPLKKKFNETHLIITYNYGGISLTDFLKKNESKFKIDITKEFYKNLLLGFVNIFEGLIIFNQNGLFHHDLAPSNILFDKEDPKNMRLIDFMLRRIRKDSVPNQNANQNDYYFALDLYELFEIMGRDVIYNKILQEKMDIIRPLFPLFNEIFDFFKSMLNNKKDYNKTKSYTIDLAKITELKDEMRRRIEAL
jgi:serine/threonine protein kinase